ncbi:MAG: hypothetical protein KGN77_01880 [Xanthomonadaceae bacterium]|nr:hypothetical protein [Xanthomonadaceae bacterium]
MTSITALPVATSVGPTDELLLLRQGSPDVEMLAPISLLDARYVPIAAAAGDNQLFGTSASGVPAPVGIGTGLALGGGNLTATAADHLALPLMSVPDPNATIVANSAGAAMRMPLPFIAPSSQDIPYLDSFGSPSGSDWTVPLNAALASGAPFRLRPATYLAEGDLTTGAAAVLSMFGTPGVSMIKRPTPNASSAGYCKINTTVADIHGVIFDMGGLVGSSPNWGVYVTTACQQFRAERCAFQNHTDPTLGSCLTIYGETTEDEEQRVLLMECIATGAHINGVLLTQVRNVLIWGGEYYANGSNGIEVELFSTDSMSVPAGKVTVGRARAHDNGTGIIIGDANINHAPGSNPSVVYAITNPDVLDATVVGCDVWNNTGYGIYVAAQRGRVLDNTCLNNGGGASSGLAGILGFAQDIAIRGNNVVGTSTFGVDCGQAIRADISHNLFDGVRTAMNLGGNIQLSGSGNRCVRNQNILSVSNVECSSTAFDLAFPQTTGPWRLCDTTADISAATGEVILVRDGASIELDGLDISSSGTLTATSQLILALGPLRLSRVRFNGSGRVTLTSGMIAAGVLTLPDHVLEGVLPAGTGAITSVVLQTASQVGSGVAWWTITANGGGLTAEPTVTISTDGTGVGTPVPLTWDGEVVGLSSVNLPYGTGATHATATVAPSNGVGTGGAATGQIGIPLNVGAPERRVRLIYPAGASVLGIGNAGGGVVDIAEVNGAWMVTGHS